MAVAHAITSRPSSARNNSCSLGRVDPREFNRATHRPKPMLRRAMGLGAPWSALLVRRLVGCARSAGGNDCEGLALDRYGPAFGQRIEDRKSTRLNSSQ